MDDAADEVRARIDGIKGRLPQEIRNIDVKRNKTTELFSILDWRH